MSGAPKWFLPVAILALLWNLLGCAAYLGDVLTTSEQVARMTAEQQELYRARPAWSVGATAIAVWCGAAGSLGLILRRRWATWFLVASLAGVVVQDVALFALSPAAGHLGPVVYGLQALVLVVAVLLVALARRASARGWLA